VSGREPDPRFEIVVGSLPDYEGLVAEIYIDGRYVGLLCDDDGPRMLRFDVATDANPLKLDLNVFERALAAAKARLWDLRPME
jgi:hypothetical protein